jgi:hypothetical protein
MGAARAIREFVHMNFFMIWIKIDVNFERGERHTSLASPTKNAIATNSFVEKLTVAEKCVCR